MNTSRYRLGLWVRRTRERLFGGSHDVVFGGTHLSPQQEADVLWLTITIGLIVLSGLSLWLFGLLYAQILIAVIWGFYFGFSCLVYLPDKITTGFLGGIVGAGGKDLTTAATTTGIADSLSKLSTSVEAFQKSVEASTHFVLFTPAIWLLLFILGLCCLRALLRSSSSSRASTPSPPPNPNC